MANLVGLIVKTLALLQLLLSGFFNVGGPDVPITMTFYRLLKPIKYPLQPSNRMIY